MAVGNVLVEEDVEFLLVAGILPRPRSGARVEAIGGGRIGLFLRGGRRRHATEIGPAASSVFTAGGDAVKIGLVSSINRPGGNITGVNLFFTEMGAKRLELLRILIPNANAIAMLVNPNNPTSSTDQKDVQAGARSIGVKVSVFTASRESDFEQAFADIVEQKFPTLLIGDDPFLASQRDQLVRLSARHALPTIYFSRDFADAGGLMSYGTSITNAYRQTGFYVGRILRGDKAGDLPVLQPTKFELVINLKTAKALGLEIPPTLLARADEVIE